MLMNYHQKSHYALLIKYTYLFGFKKQSRLHPQTLLEECQYRIIGKSIRRFITEDLISSGSNSESENNYEN